MVMCRKVMINVVSSLLSLSPLSHNNCNCYGWLLGRGWDEIGGHTGGVNSAVRRESQIGCVMEAV